jgi:hypothetical protein
MNASPQSHRGTEKIFHSVKTGMRSGFARCCFFLCLCVSVVSSLHAQTPVTNLGPIQVPRINFKQQTCASIPGVALLTLMCYDVSGVIEINVNNTGWVALSSSACANCVVTDGSGNAVIAGGFTALDLILSGLGPLDVVTPCNTVSAPPGGFGLWGMGSGCVPVIYPSTLSAVVPIAYQDGSGNVYQNANTATALAATPSQCSGQYATGIQANGTPNCSSSTYVLIPTITDPGATASNLSLFGTTTQIQAHVNGGSVVTVLRKDTAYMTWGPCNLGTTYLAGITQYCSWTLPAGVTVVQMDVWENVLPVSCSTYPVLVLQNESLGSPVSGFSLTLNSTTTSGTSYYNVTGSTAVPSGAVLTFKISTAANGCSGSTTPNNVTATITYQMS